MREETLDYIVERSREVTIWQEPLVRRHRLPRTIVRKLADFVADSLLAVLRQRKDLPPDILQEVTAVVRQRLAHDELTRGDAKTSGRKAQVVMPDGGLDQGGKSGKEAAPVQNAQQLHAEGRLDEEALDEALMQGNDEFVTQALALLAGLAPVVVKRAIAAQSAKGMTALAWKAGLGMRFGIKLQARLARIAPRDVLNAKNGTDYPMTPDEMDWMIGFFSE